MNKPVFAESRFLYLAREYIHNERNRNILIDRYVYDMMFKELADKYSLTERHIKRICYREFEKIVNFL